MEKGASPLEKSGAIPKAASEQRSTEAGGGGMTNSQSLGLGDSPVTLVDEGAGTAEFWGQKALSFKHVRGLEAPRLATFCLGEA